MRRAPNRVVGLSLVVVGLGLVVVGLGLAVVALTMLRLHMSVEQQQTFTLKSGWFSIGRPSIVHPFV